MSLKATNKRPSFFSVPALTLLAALITLALYVLYPRSSFFENLSSTSKPDALSIAYLEALVASDPNNASIRMSLARMYAEVGKFDTAWSVLEPVKFSENSDLSHLEAKVTVLLRAFTAESEPERKAKLRHRFYDALTMLSQHAERRDIPSPLLEDFFAVAEPDITAALLPPFLSGRSLREGLRLQQVLAGAQAASGNPGAAAETLSGIVKLLPGPEKSRIQESMIEFYLGAGQPDKALDAFIDAKLPGEDPVSLRRGIELARYADNTSLEAKWLERLSESSAVNLSILRRLIDMQLATGEVIKASVTAEKMLVSKETLTDKDVVKIAQVFDWSSKPEKALETWLLAYQMKPSKRAFQRTEALAASLGRWESLIELFELSMRHRQLSPPEHIKLADSYARLGELDKATQVLGRGLVQHSDNAEIRDQLVKFYFDDLRYVEAIEVLTNASELSEVSRLMLADLYWRTRQPEQALAVLAQQEFSGAAQRSAALMRLNIAVALADYGTVRGEYRKLVGEDPSQLSDDLLERLWNLAYVFEEYDQVIRIGKILFGRSGEADFISSVASVQASLLKWPELRETLKFWRKSTDNPESDVSFLIALAAYYQSESRPDDALDTLRRALRLSPGSEDAMVALGWLKLGYPELSVEEFPAILERLAVNPKPDRLSLLIEGYSVLGNNRAVHHWRKYQAFVDSERKYRTPTLERELAGTALSSGGYRAPNTLKAMEGGYEINDVGRMTVQSRALSAVYGWGSYSVQGSFADLGVTGDTLFDPEPRNGTESEVSISKYATNWLLDIGVGHRERIGSHDLWGRVSLERPLTKRWSVGLSHELGERALDSAESWWLAGKNQTSFSVRYAPTARVAVTASYGDISYDTYAQSSLAQGHELNVLASYQVWFSHPNWVLEAGYSSQRLSDLNELDDKTSAMFEQPIDTSNVVTEDYRRFGIGSRWQKGQASGLDSLQVGTSWFVDTRAGYVLSSDSVDFGVSAGMGIPLLGRDRLSVSGGWQSDTLDGSASASVQATYTLYFSD